MINATDRYYIERKYHNPDEEFNPYNRMKYHGEGYDTESGLDDAEILSGLKAMQDELDSLSHPIARSRVIKYVLENERLYVNEHDWFVGMYTLNRDDVGDQVTLYKWVKESVDRRTPELNEYLRLFNESGANNIWEDFDHVVPDWEALTKLGFPGIKARAAEYRSRLEAKGELTAEQSDFFESIDILYNAIIAFVDRLYCLAASKKHSKAARIAECLKHLRDGAPTDIYEAMQLMLIYFLISECIAHYQVRSLGNGLDRTLYPFYKKDIESGRYTRDEIKELLEYFLLQWSAIGNYWGQPMYLGGTNPDGTTRVNDLSYDIIDAYEELGIYNPKIQIKYNSNIPRDFINKIFNMIRNGRSSFVFCCEPGMIKAVMGYGATYAEALDMDIRGCYETGVRANEVSTGTSYVNAAKAVEYAFFNGFDNRISKQVGLKTGDVSKFKSFEDFYAAVLTQWSFIIEKGIEIINEFEKDLSYINPSSIYSATVEESLKNARDGYQNGVKFNNSALLNCGFASLVDSCMAVKKLVYDQGELSITELRAALENNWNGYERIRAKIKKLPFKYGNGEPETDLYAAALAEWFANKVNNRPNARGGVFKAVMHSAMQFVWQGEKTGATPDGRMAGEELSKNGSPSVGADKNGVTALINSACALNPTLYHESFCVDAMLHPSAVSGPEGLDIMRSLLDTYMNNNGMSIQLNIFNADTLREAQREPEKYKNLQVRVCGWNVLWNNLSKKEQDAYILRAESIQ